MPIERILFPTKFRELAFNSLESMFVLKKVGLKEIILLHVIPREEVGFVPYGGYLREEEEKLREEARIRFEDWQKSLSEKGIDSRVLITVGDPFHEILDIAEMEKVDLIVIGRKKRILKERSFIGSHTLQIISRSRIPTLVSKYMVQFECDGATLTKVNDRIFESPMLVTDWSEPSKRALDLLISLNGVVREAIIFHNIDVKHHKKGLRQMEKECRQRLEENCKRLGSAGMKAGYHLGAGDIVQEILRMSRERKASLIITGTTRKDRLHDIWPGSVSHQVAKASELPTILVP